MPNVWNGENGAASFSDLFGTNTRADTESRLQGLLNGANNPNSTSGGFSGIDYNYFTNLLKGQMDKGLSATDLAPVNTKYDQAQKTLKQNLAQNGMFNSGVGAQAGADLEGARYGAITQADLGFKQTALKNLLGLQEMGLQETGQNRNYLTSLLQLLQNPENTRLQGQIQSDNQPDPWGSILGSLISGGAQVGSAALIASDKKLKENIKEVGKTKSGLPIVEFNYKDNPVTYRGHIAQEIEKKFPKAVFKAIDYSKLPADAVFEILD